MAFLADYSKSWRHAANAVNTLATWSGVRPISPYGGEIYGQVLVSPRSR